MLNHLTFQGRLTKDIEKKTTQSGISTISFTLAWSEKYKETEDKCFLRCKAWRGTADFIDKYMHDKGTEILVEGKLGTEEWTDKDDNKRSETVLTVDKVHFCGKRQSGSEQPAPAPSGYTSADPDEPLPF